MFRVAVSKTRGQGRGLFFFWGGGGVGINPNFNPNPNLKTAFFRKKTIKIYEVGVSAKTATGYFNIFEEQVVRLQSKVLNHL